MKRNRHVLAASLVVCAAWRGAASAGEVRRSIDIPHTAVEVSHADGDFVVISRWPTSMPGPDDDSVVVVSREGRTVLSPRLSLELPGSTSLNIRAATLARGELLVAADQVVGNRHRNIIVGFHGRSGKRTRVIDTRSLACMDIAVDPTGAIWCLGSDTDVAATGARDWKMLHQIGDDGSARRSLLGRDELSPATPAYPLFATPQGPTRLVAAGKHLFVWLAPLQQLAQVELATGNVHRRIGVPKLNRGCHLAAGGAIVIGSPGGKPGLTRLLEYDATANSWVEIPGASEIPNRMRLVGRDADGFILWDRAARQLVWWSDDREAARE